jgi:hypothetical protein
MCAPRAPRRGPRGGCGLVPAEARLLLMTKLSWSFRHEQRGMPAIRDLRKNVMWFTGMAAGLPTSARTHMSARRGQGQRVMRHRRRRPPTTTTSAWHGIPGAISMLARRRLHGPEIAATSASPRVRASRSSSRCPSRRVRAPRSSSRCRAGVCAPAVILPVPEPACARCGTRAVCARRRSSSRCPSRRVRAAVILPVPEPACARGRAAPRTSNETIDDRHA